MSNHVYCLPEHEGDRTCARIQISQDVDSADQKEK